jgi:hypothetical protein
MTSIRTSFVHVLVTDGPFFISPAGSDQLHQDLDGHRPNLWQEVGGLDVRKLVNLVQQLEQVSTVENDGKSDENMTNFWRFCSGLAFKYLPRTLKWICRAPARLIDKRGLICDHS